MTSIILQSAREFDLLEPRADLITTLDIAHALSLICRFNGHCNRHYSVAQHSLLVADIVQSQGHGPEIQLLALMHDAPEAYVGDMTRPLKQEMRWFARNTEQAVRWACEQHGADHHQLIKALRSLTLRSESSEPYRVFESLYTQVEHRIWLAICEHFALDPELPACIHEADMIALATERRDLLPDHPSAWECLQGITPHRIELENWAPGQARQAFHDRLLEVLGTTHRARAAA